MNLVGRIRSMEPHAQEVTHSTAAVSSSSASLSSSSSSSSSSVSCTVQLPDGTCDVVPVAWWKLSPKWTVAMESCSDMERDDSGRVVIRLVDVTPRQWTILREYLAHHAGRV